MAQLSLAGQYWYMWHIETCVPTLPLVAQKALTCTSYIETCMPTEPLVAQKALASYIETCVLTVRQGTSLYSIEHFPPFLVHFRFQILPFLAQFWHVLNSVIYGTSAISGSTISAKLSWFIQRRTLSAISGTFQFLPLLAHFRFYHLW